MFNFERLVNKLRSKLIIILIKYLQRNMLVVDMLEFYLMLWEDYINSIKKLYASYNLPKFVNQSWYSYNSKKYYFL